MRKVSALHMIGITGTRPAMTTEGNIRLDTRASDAYTDAYPAALR
jgi:hypothetical protein